MEEIFQAASELGLMIKDTEVYRSFALVTARVNEDEEALALLQEYSRTAEELHQKEQAGGIVEVFEKERFQELVDGVQSNELLMEFLQSRDQYIRLLTSVQEALEE